MVETANLGELNDRTEFRRLHLSGLRCILSESKVRPGSVVVAKVTEQNPPQMAFVENDHMVEAFPPDGTDDALDIRILPWGTWRNENLLDAESVDTAREVLTVDTVAVKVTVGTVKKSMATRSALSAIRARTETQMSRRRNIGTSCPY